ncbi:MAG: murein biosynthesis integral membrane protein MurJ [Fusobacteriaceae bacterium]|jgi:putative peptidoglycan lipid II flippase|nr:murein biosynthesis integral membrane protein MurJ [Fusobacteriaceae bacterium]
MFKSGVSVMMIIFASRVLGLVRAATVAFYFGAGSVTDAYFSAFKISNFFRQLLGEGALGNAFIPVYNEAVEAYGEKKSRDLIFSVLNLIFVFSSLVTIVMILGSGPIISVMAPGFDPATKKLASSLLKIMSVYFIFISLSGMICAVLNNYKKFAVPASTSIFFNLAIIGASLWGSRRYGIYALTAGVVVGGAFQLLVVLPSFFAITRRYKLSIDWKDPYLRKIFVLMVPMLVGIVAREINTFVDQLFASYLDPGGVSALENATRLYLLPVGVFGISLSTIIFPALSKAVVRNDRAAAQKNILQGLHILLFLIIPSICVLTVYGKDIIRLTLSYGKFGEEAVTVTGGALFYYALGLYFYTGIHLMTRAFYSMKDSKLPVAFSVISIAVNIILNFILIRFMRYKGLALATACASGVNFLLLFFVFRKKYLALPLKKTGIFLGKTLITAAAALLSSYFIKNTPARLAVFSGCYMALWAGAFIKRKMEVF